MGLFGPTPEELRLKSELDGTNRTLNDTRTKLAQKCGEFDRLKAAASMTEVAESAVEQALTSGEIQISAYDTAANVVKSRYMGHTEATIADTILSTQEDAIRAERSEAWDEEIRTKLRTRYEADGTFDRLRSEIDGRDIQSIADSLREEEQATHTAFNQTPERQAELRELAMGQLEETGVLADIRTAIESKAYSEWIKIAEEEARGEIADEIESTKLTFIDTARQKWRDSHQGKQFAALTKDKLEKQWRDATHEEVSAEVKDEILSALLAEKADRAKQALEAEAFVATYIEGLTGKGMDTTKIPEGFILEIYLGGGITEKAIKDRHGYATKEVERTLKPERVLTLTSLGEAEFRVEDDSLNLSQSPYDRQAALRSGVIMHIGREKLDKSNGNGEPELDRSIRRGVPLFYDEDVKDPRISSAHLPVTEVALNGTRSMTEVKIRLDGASQ